MNEELYDLYKRDQDFHDYVDKWCKAHNLGIFEAFQMNILKEYGEYIKNERGSIEHDS